MLTDTPHFDYCLVAGDPDSVWGPLFDTRYAMNAVNSKCRVVGLACVFIPVVGATYPCTRHVHIILEDALMLAFSVITKAKNMSGYVCLCTPE